MQESSFRFISGLKRYVRGTLVPGFGYARSNEPSYRGKKEKTSALAAGELVEKETVPEEGRHEKKKANEALVLLLVNHISFRVKLFKKKKNLSDPPKLFSARMLDRDAALARIICKGEFEDHESGR